MRQRGHRWRAKRVVHLTTVHPPGDTRISLKECRTLAAAGFDVTLIGSGSQSPPTPGFHYQSIGDKRGRLHRMTLFAIKMLRAARATHADLYHFHDPELIPVGLILRLGGARVVYDAHEDLPRQIAHKFYLPPLSRPLASVLASILENIAARFLSAIVAATPQIAARFPAKKTVVVQNFPIIGELDSVDRREDAGPPVVTYVGRLTPVAGCYVMAEAARLAAVDRHIRFVFAGSADLDVLDEVRRRAGEANVELPGWQSRTQVADLLWRARVGLVLFQPTQSHLESYPTKLFEYMATALPVIASDFPLWRRIVSEAECGLVVDPESPRAVADAILQLLDHPQRAEMGARGRASVQDRFRWDAQGARLVLLYEQLLA